jgi:EmrB/QacA subfamily drug resistance transporter
VSERNAATETQVAPPANLKVILPGLMLAMLLAMLDNMIVGTAMPKIIADLGGLDHFTWVVTAYVLGTSVSTPLWGKLGDLYGRKTVFIVSIVLFLFGSALCGMAQDMAQLIGFRALQGLGAGGLMVGVMAIIGDLLPPRERGKYQGQFAGIMAIAMVGGPLIGGFIADNLNWRWAFYVNLPLGGIALLVLIVKLHLPKYRTEHRIDWLGAVLLSVSITSIVLVTTWGGNEYAWSSWQIVGLAVLGVATLVAFLAVERMVTEPIVPLSLFRNRNFTLVSGIGFLLGFAMFGAINFLPLYQQLVQEASATNSGLLLLPMMFGLLVTSIFVGQAITRTGRYKVFPIVGGVVMTVGMVLLSLIDAHTPKLTSALYMTVLGLGMGCLMQTTMLIAQNSVDPRDLGVASSAATFFRSIGGSFGVALFGAIFVNRLREDLGKSLGSDAAERFASGGGGMSADPEQLRAMPDALREAIQHAVALGSSTVFRWAIPIVLLVPLLAVFIKEVPLRGRDDSPTAEEATADAEVAML